MHARVVRWAGHASRGGRRLILTLRDDAFHREVEDTQTGQYSYETAQRVDDERGLDCNPFDPAQVPVPRAVQMRPGLGAVL